MSDTQAPVITITSPKPNQRILRGVFQIKATGTATDNTDGDISSRIVWKVTNRLISTQTLTSTEAANLQNLPAGTYALTAEAMDAAGNKTTLAGPQFVVYDPPAGIQVYLLPISHQATGTTSLKVKVGWSGLPENQTYLLTVGMVNTSTNIERDEDYSISSNVARTGTHELTITGLTDGVWNLGIILTDIRSQKVANTPLTKIQIGDRPVLTVESPVNNTTYGKGTLPTIALVATAKDKNNKVLTPVWKDITDPDNIKDPPNILNVKSWPLGTYKLRVSATDSSGLSSEVVLTIHIVNPIPVVTITSPTNNQKIVQDVYDISAAGSVVDFLGETLNTAIQWRINNTVVSANILNNLDDLVVGTYTLSASVTDTRYSAGNTGTASITFSVVERPDTPTLYLTGLKPSDTVPANLALTIGYASLTNDQHFLLTLTYYRRVKDLAGKNVTDTWKRVGDDDDAVYQQLNSDYGTYGSFLPIAVRIETGGQYEFRTMSVVTSGSNVLQFNPETARSIAPLLQEFVWFGRDTHKPTIAITKPTANQRILSGLDSGPVVNATATATDNRDGDLTSKIRWLNVVNNKATYTRTIGGTLPNLQNYPEGTHTIKAKVLDSAQNEAFAMVSFVVYRPADTTAPTITISSPNPNQMIRANTAFDLVASAKDDRDLTVNVSWFRITLDDMNNEISTALTTLTGLTFATTGTYTFEARASDKAGNTAKKRVSIEITLPADVTAPTLTITNPLNGAKLASHVPITLTAMAIDDRDGDISSKVKWFRIATIGGKERTFTITNTTFTLGHLGHYTFEARITDAGGNTAKKRVSIEIIDAQNPIITLASPIDKSTYFANRPIALTGSASDNIDPVISPVWTLNGDIITGNSIMLEKGNYELVISATDSAGNSSTKTITFKVIFDFEQNARRIDFIRAIGNIASSVNDVTILKRMSLDITTANQLFSNRINDKSPPYLYHALIIVSDIISSIILASRSLEDNEVAFTRLRTIYPDIVRAALNTFEGQDKTTIDIQFNKGDKGTFK